MARAAHTPHLWSRSEYERMAEAGVFEPGVRMELIDGEILEMAPQGTRHFTAIRLIEDALRAVFGDGWDIRTQGPLAIDDSSEPEPDVAVVRGAPRDFKDAHPASAQLVVEVADTSLGFDRLRKGRLYARNCIPEYWIVDLAAGQLEIYRAPEGEDYADKRILGAADRISPLSTSDAELAVVDLLP